jgi:hypothetical protein
MGLLFFNNYRILLCSHISYLNGLHSMFHFHVHLRILQGLPRYLIPMCYEQQYPPYTALDQIPNILLRSFTSCRATRMLGRDNIQSALNGYFEKTEVFFYHASARLNIPWGTGPS